jgi:hypothetical protein
MERRNVSRTGKYTGYALVVHEPAEAAILLAGACIVILPHCRPVKL